MEKMCLFFCWSDSREPYNTNVAYISSQKSINVLLWSFFCFILFYLVRKVILIFCNIFLKLLFIVFLSKYYYFSLVLLIFDGSQLCLRVHRRLLSIALMMI